MDRRYIESSMIRSIGFDSESSILEIEFNSGAIWQYSDFPESEWYLFESSESKGRFFLSSIKDQYSEYRVG